MIEILLDGQVFLMLSRCFNYLWNTIAFVYTTRCCVVESDMGDVGVDTGWLQVEQLLKHA